MTHVVPDLARRRPVEDFFEDLRKERLEAGEYEHSDMIRFLDWLITNVNNDATIDQQQEKELTNGIEWEWWCSADGEPVWYVFLNLFETLPK
ncbi:MAG: hypothetical protein WCT49_05115 [Candidatus Paceibacterota bacterium]|jgi:hypothetical protein|nr:hypothetical protein [Candidatus Paceibacterota bacterium]